MSRRVQQKGARKSGAVRRVFRLLLILVILALGIPPVQVLWVKYRDPRWTPLMKIRELEGTRPARVMKDRTWVRIEETPRLLIRAVVVSEDARFLKHDGFDWEEIEAALGSARRKGRGASTITQQCARSVFLWQGRSFVRKGLEAYYTLWMEWLLSKERILELYMNLVETGNGAYGMDAGARLHFGRPLGKLSDRQLVWMAALLPAPRKWDPNKPSPKLRFRYNLIREREPGLKFPAWGRDS
jgi:monofunctional biosynthetic peptidoglycan transglycosylase